MKTCESCGLLMLYLLAEVAAGPIEPQLCAQTCTANSKFNYQPRATYIYKYETEIVSSTQKESTQKATMNVKATVHIEAVTKCNLVLRLENVVLTASDDNNDQNQLQYFKSQLEANSLMFAFQDGHIEELCHKHEEPAWVLNVKRGILSMFQSTMKSRDAEQNIIETDVAGTCPTEYKVTRTGFTKEKDLNACTKRNHFYGPLHTSSESTSLLKSTQKCDQIISENIFKKVTCEEEHAFQPFSHSDSHVTSSIRQTLTFQEFYATQSTSVESLSTRSSLLFHHTSERFGETNPQNEAEDSLRKLCTISKNKALVPGLFATFVFQLKQLNENELRNIFGKLETICPEKQKIRKIFLDGLQMAQSPASVTLMSEHLQNGEISEMEAKSWFSSLAFISNPTTQMLSNLAALPERIALDQNALLGISSLIHTYCKVNSNCHLNPHVKILLENYVHILGDSCQVQNDNHYIRKMIALKAIGNTGIATNYVNILEKCFSPSQNPVEIRITAIDALRRIPCDKKSELLWKMYSDFEVNSEVRIAAFKMLMKCPTPEIVNDIEEILKREEVSQVGSYVWTYLTNAQESVDPCKKEIHEILYSELLKKKFSTDVRKFSRAFEGSAHSEVLNAGVHADGDIIFPTNSFLPHSAYLNLTVDVLGTSMNLLEIGGYAEGLEPLVESFVGTKKRQTKNPEASLYLRVFGNDLHYLSTKERQTNERSFHSVLSQLMNQKEIDITKNVMLLNIGLITPTISGFPLSLTANGTAAINLQVKGHLDIHQLQEKNANVTLQINPSAAIQVVGTMAVDGFVKRSGTRLVASLHTSTPLSGKFEISHGQLLNIRLDVPDENVDVFDIKSELFLLNGNHETILAANEQNRKDDPLCTGPQTSYLFGTEACAIIQYSEPTTQDALPFPFNGHARAALVIKKTDPTLTHYLFQYKTNEIQQNKDVFLRYLTLNTPGSTIDREFTGDIAVNFVNHSIKTRFITPFKKIEFEGKCDYGEELKYLDGSLKMDGKSLVAVNISSITTHYQDTSRHEHELEVDLGGQPVIAIKGHTTSQSGHKYAMDYAMHHVSKQPIIFSGNAAHTNMGSVEKYDVDVTLKALQHTFKTKGNIKKGTANLSSTLAIQHLTPNQEVTNYELAMKHRDATNHETYKQSFSASLKGTNIIPLSMILSYYRQMATIRTQLDLSRGEGQQKKTLSLQNVLSYELQDHQHNITSVLDIDCIKCGVNYHLGFNHHYNATTMSTEIKHKYMTNKQMLTKWLESKLPINDRKIYLNSVFALNPYEVDWNGIYQWDTDESYKRHVNYYAHPDTGYGIEMNFYEPKSSPMNFMGRYQSGPHRSIRSELDYGGNKYALDLTRQNLKNGFKLSANADVFNRLYSGELLIDLQRPKGMVAVNCSIDNEPLFSAEARYEYNEYNFDINIDIRGGSQHLTLSTEYRRQGESHNVLSVLKTNQKVYQLTFSTKTFGKLHSDIFLHTSYLSLKLPHAIYQIDFASSTKGMLFSSNFTHVSEFKYLSNNVLVIGSKVNMTHYSREDERFYSMSTRNTYKYSVQRVFQNDASLHLLRDSKTGWKAEFYLNQDQEPRTQNPLTVDAKLYFRNFLDLWKKFKVEMALFLRQESAPYHVTLTHEIQNNAINTILHYEKNEHSTLVKITGNFVQSDSKLNINGDYRIERIHHSNPKHVPLVSYYNFTAIIEQLPAVLKVKGQFDANGKSISILGNIQVDSSKPIISFSLHTPYEKLKAIQVTAMYTIENSRLRSLLEVTWNDKEKAAIEITGIQEEKRDFKERRSTTVAGSFHVVYSKANVDLLLSFSHDLDYQSVIEKLELKWSEDEKVTFQYDMSQRPQESKVEITLFTPFTSIKQAGIKLDVKFTTGETSAKVIQVEMFHNYNKIALDIHMSREPRDDQSKFLLTVNLESTFRFLRVASLRLIDSRTPNGYFDTYIETKVENHETSLHQHGRVRNFYTLDYNFHLKTPLQALKNLQFSVQNNESDSVLEHKSSISWNLQNSYSLFLQLQSPSRDVYEGKFQLATPTATYGPYQLSMKIENSPHQYRLIASVKDDAEEHASMIYRREYGQTQVVALSMQSSLPALESMSLSVEQSQNEQFDINITTQWNEEFRIKVGLQGYAKLEQSDLKITLSTPFDRFDTIIARVNHDVSSSLYHADLKVSDELYSFKILHKLENVKRIALISLKMPDQKLGVFFHSAIAQNKYEIDLRLNVDDRDFATGQVVLLTLADTFSLKIDATTPFPGYETISTALKYGQPNYDPEMFYLKMQIDDQDVEIKLNGMFSKWFDGEMNLAVFSKYYKLYTGFQMEIQQTFAVSAIIKAKIYYNHEVIEGNLKLMYLKGQILANLKTPFDGYENIELHSDFQREPYTYSANVMLRCNERWIKISAKAKIQDDASEFKFKIETRHPRPIMDLEFSCDVSTPAKKIHADLKVLQHHISLTSSLITEFTDMQISTELFSRTDDITNFHIEWKLNLKPREQMGSIMLNATGTVFNNEKCLLEISYSLKGRREKHAELIVHKGNYRLQGKAEISKRSKKFQLKLITPITSYEKISLSVNYNTPGSGRSNRRELNAKMNLGNDVIEVRGSDESDETDRKMVMTITSSFSGFEHQEVHATYRTEQASKLVIINLQTPTSNHWIDGSITFNETSGRIDLKLSDGTESLLAISGDVSIAKNNLRANIVLHIHEDKSQLSFHYVPASNLHEMKIQLMTPYEGFRDMGIALDCFKQVDRRGLELQGSVMLWLDRSKIVTLKGKITSESSAVKGELYYANPFDNLNIKVDSNLDWGNKIIAVSIKHDDRKVPIFLFMIEAENNDEHKFLKITVHPPLSTYKSLELHTKREFANIKNSSYSTSIEFKVIATNDEDSITMQGSYGAKNDNQHRFEPVVNIELRKGIYEVKFQCEFEVFSGTFSRETDWIEVATTNGKIQLEIPYGDYRHVAFFWKSNWADKDFEISLSGEINDQKMELTAGRTQETEHNKVQIQLITPFESLRRVGASFVKYFRSEEKTASIRIFLNENSYGAGFQLHTDDISNSPIFNADVTWGINEGIQLMLMKMSTDSNYQLLLTTPFASCERNSLILLYNIDDIKNSRISVTGQLCSSKAELRGSVESDGQRITLTADVNDGANSIANLDTVYNRNNMRHEINSHIQWRENQRISIQGTFNDDDTSSGYLIVTTTFERYQRMTIRFRYSKNPNHPTAMVSITPPSSRRVQFNLDGDFEDINRFSFNSTIRLPIQGLELISINAKHHATDKRDGFVHVGWKRNKNLNVSWSIGKKSLAFTLETPFENLSYLKTSGSASSKRGEVSLKAEVEYKTARTTEKLGYVFNFAHNLPDYLTLTSHLYTSFKQFQSLYFDVRHSYQRDSVNSNVVITIPYLLTRTTGDFLWKKTGKDTQLSIIIKNGKNIIETSGRSQVSLPTAWKGELKFNTNMFHMPLKSIVVDYNNDRNANVRATLQLNTQQSSYAYSAVYNREQQKINVQLDIDWPSSRATLDRVSLKGMAFNENGVGNGSFIIMLPSGEHKATTKFSVSDNNVKGSFLIASNHLKNDIQGDYNIDVRHSPQGENNVQFLLRLSTPFLGINKIEFSYDKNTKCFETELLVGTETEEYKQHIKTCNGKQFAIHIEAPPLRRTGKIVFDGNLLIEKEPSLVVTLSTPTYNFHGKSWIAEKTLHADLKVNSPMMEWPLIVKWALTVDTTKYDMRKYVFDFSLQKQTQHSFSFIYVNDPTEFICKTIFKNPDYYWNSEIKINKERNQGNQDFKLSVELATPTAKHFANATYETTRRGFIAEVNMHCPLLHQRPIKLFIDMYFSNPRIMDATWKIVIGDQTHSISANVLLNGTKYAIESTLLTDGKKVYFISSLDWKNPESRELYARISLNGEDYKLFARSHCGSEQHASRIQIQTPLISFTEFEADLKIHRNTGWKLNFDMYLKNYNAVRSFRNTIEKTADTFFVQSLLDLAFAEPIGLSFGGNYNNGVKNGQITATHGNREYRMEFSMLNVHESERFHNHGNASLVISIPVDGKTHSIKAIMNYNHDLEVGFTGKIEINTSFENYKFFSIQALNNPKWKKHDFVINVQTPFHNFETIVIHTRTTVDKVTRTVKHYCGLRIQEREYTEEIIKTGNDITVSFGWKVNRRLTTLKTIIKTFPEQKFQISLTGPDKEIFSGHVAWQSYRNTSFEVEVSYYEQTFGFVYQKLLDRVQVEIKTPFAEHKLTTLNVVWKHVDRHLNVAVTLSIHQGIYNANVKLGNKFYNIELKTPLDKLNNLRLDLSYENDIIFDVTDNGIQIFKLQMPITLSEGTYTVVIFDRSMYASITRNSLADNSEQKTINGEICFDKHRCVQPDVRFYYGQHSTATTVNKTAILQEGTRTLKWTYSSLYWPQGYRSQSAVQWGETRHERLSYDFVIVKSVGRWIDSLAATLKFSLFSQDYEINGNYKTELTTGRSQPSFEASLLFKWYDYHENKIQEAGLKAFFEKAAQYQSIKLFFVHPALRKDILMQIEREHDENYQSSQTTFLLDYSMNKQDQFTIKLTKSINPEATTNDGAKWNLKMIHLPSALNSSISLMVHADQHEIQYELHFQHVDRFEQQHSYQAQLKIMKLQKTATMTIKMNENVYLYLATANSTPKGLELMLSIRRNSEAPTIAKIQYLKQYPEVVLNIRCNSADQLTISVGMPRPTLLNFLITHGNDTFQTKDVDFSMALQNGNILKTRLQWRPESLFTIMEKIIVSYRSAQEQCKEQLHEMKAEIKSKIDKFINKIKLMIEPIENDMIRYMNNFHNDVRITFEASYRTWKESKLYSKYLRYILLHYSEWSAHMMNYAISFARYLNGLANFACNKISMIQQRIGVMINNFLESLLTKARLYAQDAAQVVKDIHYKLFKIMYKSISIIYNYSLQPILEKWVYPVVKRVHETAREVTYNSFLLVLDVIVDPNLVMSTYNIIRGCYINVTKQCSRMIERGLVQVNQMMMHPYVKHSISFMQTAYNLMEEFMMDEKVSALLRQMYSTIETEAYNIAYDIIIAYPTLKIDTSHNVVYNPTDGLIEYNQHLPITWSNFKQLPNFEEVLEFKNLTQWRDHIFNHIHEVTSNIYKMFHH